MQLTPEIYGRLTGGKSLPIEAYSHPALTVGLSPDGPAAPSKPQPTVKLPELGEPSEYLQERKIVWLYFLCRASDGYIKIGQTTDLCSRIDQIRARVGCDVHELMFMQGSRDLERRLHKEFANDRADGEWFRPSASLLKRMMWIRAHWYEILHPESAIAQPPPLPQRGGVDE